MHCAAALLAREYHQKKRRHTLQCHFAAMELTLRGANVDKPFWTLGSWPEPPVAPRGQLVRNRRGQDPWNECIPNRKGITKTMEARKNTSFPLHPPVHERNVRFNRPQLCHTAHPLVSQLRPVSRPRLSRPTPKPQTLGPSNKPRTGGKEITFFLDSKCFVIFLVTSMCSLSQNLQRMCEHATGARPTYLKDLSRVQNILWF